MSEPLPDTAWTSGYVSDVVYTLGFHRELAPSFLDYICLINGVEGLPTHRKLRYCELGCGRGYATVLLAAANPDIDFVGIDFNPSHIAEARALADTAGVVNVDFRDLSFGDGARSTDPRLDAFDIMAMHGVYSWVPPEVREDIHAFIRTKLIPGGIAFVSYNAMPGSTRVIPTQKLLIEAAGRAGGDSLARVATALQLAQLLVDKSDGLVARHGALSKGHLAHLATKDAHYLAHEFLNSSWQPLFVTEAMAALAEADLYYVGSAAVAENRIEFCAPKDLHETIRSAPDAAMRELLKDYIVGKQFRRDVYVKGPCPLPADRQRAALADLMFAPMPHVTGFPNRLRVPVGSLAPKPEVLNAMWNCIMAGTARGIDLQRAAITAGEREERVWPLIEILVHNGVIHPARPDPAGVDPAPAVRLNEAIMDISRSANTHGYLASPVLGSAIIANLPERVLPPLLAQEPELDDRAIAGKAFDCVNGAGQDFISDGRPVERTEDSLQSLSRFVGEFRNHRLPRWQALGIVP